MPYVDDRVTIRELIERRAREDPDWVFCRFEDEAITYRALDESVNRLANGLAGLGIGAGDRVAVMLPNHPDHIYTFLALAKLGAIWVPVNYHLKGASLEFLIEHAGPHAAIVDLEYQETILPLLWSRSPETVIWRGGLPADAPAGWLDFADVMRSGSADPPPGEPTSADVVIISYTSGTTGQPKGVLVTDKMLRTCATGVAIVTEVRDGDVLLMWEPIHHNGGNQILILALMHRITVALLDRFSASQFWSQVRRYGATQIHYLGGVLQILMKQPARPDDTDHSVRVAWGGGCVVEIWREFEQRFGVRIHEDYGQTETCSINTVNLDGKVGSIGKPVPYFDLKIIDEDGRTVGPNVLGEIAVRGREPGLIMSGYFRNPEATARALQDEWLHTGDLGSYDDEGYFYFAGRQKDSVRRRGENVSAWEVERVVNEHPDVEESALVGVATDIGEEDLKIFIKPVSGREPDPAAVIAWCRGRMAYFQVPRYVAFIDAFEKTPTERIKKEQLSRATDDCWDRERAAASG